MNKKLFLLYNILSIGAGIVLFSFIMYVGKINFSLTTFVIACLFLILIAAVFNIIVIRIKFPKNIHGIISGKSPKPGQKDIKGKGRTR